MEAPARRAGRRRLPGLRPRPARLRRQLGARRGRRLRLRRTDRRSLRPARPLRLPPRHLLGARLGGHDRVGDGPTAPRACGGHLQHERPVLACERAAHGDIPAHLRRQVLLHALLPRCRAGRGGIRRRPPPLRTHHALLRRRRGHGHAQSVPCRRASRGDSLPRHPHSGTRCAAGLAHRARRRRLHRGALAQRPLRTAQLLPQPRCQLGALQEPPGLALHDADRVHHRFTRPRRIS